MKSRTERNIAENGLLFISFHSPKIPKIIPKIAPRNAGFVNIFTVMPFKVGFPPVSEVSAARYIV